MAFVITLGSKVRARFGTLQAITGKGKRRSRAYIHGIVVESRPGGLWRIYWEDIRRTSDHASKSLIWLAPRGADLTDTDLSTLNTTDIFVGDSDGIKNYMQSNGTTTFTAQPPLLSGPVPNQVQAADDDLSRHNEVASRIIAEIHAENADATASATSGDDSTLPSQNLLPANRARPVNTHHEDSTASATSGDDSTLLSQNLLPANRARPANTTHESNAVDDHVFDDEDEDDEEGNNPRYNRDDGADDPNWIMEEMFEGSDRHAQLQAAYQRRKAALIEKKVSVTVGKHGESAKWTVRDDVKRNITPDVEFHKQIGVRGFDFKERPVCADGKNQRINFKSLLEHLWPGDWRRQLENMNSYIKKANATKKRSARTIRSVTPREFWAFLGIMLVARIEGIPGGNLWKNSGRTEGYRNVVNLDKGVMMEYRFRQIKTYVSFLWADESLKDTDPWWQIIRVCEEFGLNRMSTILSSNIKIADETMAAMRPRTTKTANLPHLSHILRKPEDLGTEFKTVATVILNIMLGLEIARSKDDLNGREFVDTLKKKTTACSVRLMKMSSQRALFKKEEAQRENSMRTHASGTLQPETPGQKPVINSDASDDCFLGDSWFGSVATALAMKKALPEKCSSITQIKTAHSRYPKAFLEKEMKNWPGGSHLVLEAIIENERLFAVGYKYSKRKNLCFLFNEGASSTEPGTPYVAKWMDENGNRRMREVPRPECCATYFQHSNVIDVLNQQRQKELRLEKFWVTTDGFFRLFTTVFGICVVDCWNGYRFHLDSGHRHKNCELMEYVNMLAMDLIHNDESDELEVADDTICIPAAGVPVREVNISSTSTVASELTSPSPSHPSKSDLISKDAKKMIELAKHQLHLVDAYTEVTRKRKSGRTGREVTVQAKRRKRFNCRECLGMGVEKKVSFYCNECEPPSSCMKYWLCHDCMPMHCKRISDEIDAKH